MVRRQSKRASSASKPLSAVEALMLELEGVDPRELERLSVAAGLAPGQAPDMGALRAYRMDRSGAAESSAQPSSAPAAPSLDWALVHKPVRDDVAGALPSGRVRVHGDAMRDAGLRDGDIVELDADMEPEDGDIVLAHVEGFGRVLRTLKIIGGVQVLAAALPGVPSIAVEDDAQITFHGVVVQATDR